ncbi:VOC family protein [Streptomyces flaveolus]|uniref:VOC family protein n=1 Tax=Streptomyces flaveolus TaxID=67297 RepID=UPI003429BA7E
MTYVEGKIERVPPQRFHETVGLEDWRVLGEGACAHFRAGSSTVGARLVQAISELPGVDAGHPDIDVRYDGVTVRLITLTDDFYGLSERDVELARRISALARPQRNRMHVDVWVPYDRAEARIAAALAAGGRLVSDAHAPSHWVLTDPEGNEACVGTAGWIGPGPTRR